MRAYPAGIAGQNKQKLQYLCKASALQNVNPLVSSLSTWHLHGSQTDCQVPSDKTCCSRTFQQTDPGARLCTYGTDPVRLCGLCNSIPHSFLLLCCIIVKLSHDSLAQRVDCVLSVLCRFPMERMGRGVMPWCSYWQTALFWKYANNFCLEYSWSIVGVCLEYYSYSLLGVLLE